MKKIAGFTFLHLSLPYGIVCGTQRCQADLRDPASPFVTWPPFHPILIPHIVGLKELTFEAKVSPTQISWPHTKS